MPTVPASPSSNSTSNGEGSVPVESGITILVADDDDILRDLFSTVLSDLGYRVLSAPDGQSAMRILTSEGIPKINLLLSDYRMPFMCGDELASRFRQSNPDAAIIIMSGETPELSPALRCTFISKPFPIHKLGEMVQAALASRNSPG